MSVSSFQRIGRHDVRGQMFTIAWISTLCALILSSQPASCETELLTNGEIQFYPDSFLIADDYALIAFKYEKCLGCSSVQQWHFELESNGFIVLSQDVNAQTSVYPKASQAFSSLTPGQTYKLTISTIGLENAFNNEVTVSESVSFTTRSDLQCSVLTNSNTDNSNTDTSGTDMDTAGVFFACEAYAVNYASSYELCSTTWSILDYGPYKSSARYLAVHSPTEKTVIVAFRGTDFTSASDLIVNLDADSEECNRYIFNGQCQGRVHSGYAREYQDVAPQLRAAILVALQAGYRRVLVTGHSQGAAQATIVAYDLLVFARANSFNDVEIRHVNFGSPSALNSEFANNWNTEFASKSVRFVNRDSDGSRDFITSFFPSYTHVEALSTVNVPGDCSNDKGCHSSSIYFKQVASNTGSITLHTNPWSSASGSTTISNIDNSNAVVGTAAPLAPNTNIPAPVGSASTLATNLLGMLMVVLLSVVLVVL